ncbi:MAG: isocitrate/isopropylmalate family dehydrogenase [Thermoleophilaceae bacterium]
MEWALDVTGPARRALERLPEKAAAASPRRDPTRSDGSSPSWPSAIAPTSTDRDDARPAGAAPEVSPATMTHRIVTLPGDGIGPDVMAAAVEVLARLGDFEFTEHLVGGASIDAHGTPLTDEVLEACRSSDSVLLAAVGGPKWDNTTDPDAQRPEQGLLGLRKGLELFANLRPVRPAPALIDSSPLRRGRIEGTNLLVVRELTGGIYFGERGRTEDGAFDICTYSIGEVERITEVALQSARSRITSVDKANILETSRLWRETVERVAGNREDIDR